MKKSQYFVIAVLMIAAFVLAACPAATPAPTTSSGDTAATSGDTTTSSASGDTATSCECTDPKGCVTVGANDPVRVGWMMVVSGADATLGLDSKFGAEIAADDRGTIAGHAIELTGEDDLCSAEGGQTAAQKMSADSKLTAVIGTSCSSAARAAIPVMCNAGVPMISASNTAPDLTAADRPADYWCYMRTAHNDLVQGAAMAEYAYGAGYRKAATVHDGSLYADQLQQVFAGRPVPGQRAGAAPDRGGERPGGRRRAALAQRLVEREHQAFAAQQRGGVDQQYALVHQAAADAVQVLAVPERQGAQQQLALHGEPGVAVLVPRCVVVELGPQVL